MARQRIIAPGCPAGGTSAGAVIVVRSGFITGVTSLCGPVHSLQGLFIIPTSAHAVALHPRPGAASAADRLEGEAHALDYNDTEALGEAADDEQGNRGREAQQEEDGGSEGDEAEQQRGAAG